MQPLTIAIGNQPLNLLPSQANRHGLIAGATGTGKTVTMQRFAEAFSRIGVPVFLADIKGDVSGISAAGSATPKVAERLELLKIANHPFEGCPVTFWDIYGEKGMPLRTTISDMGPLLLSRLMNLSDTQSGVLTSVFKIADDHGLLLLDLKDLKAMLQFAADNSKQFTTQYGNIATASVGAIQRGLVGLEQEGADQFFGEPALELSDLMKVDEKGRGLVNILAADKLFQSPRIYATSLLWLLSELFEQLPEAGDLEKPKLVFVFDEAHLLFEDMPKALEDKIEQVVRLIRSKGVGVYFVTQNPLDIPESILGQLGNRVQHALRAYTQKDTKAVKAAAQSFRTNPGVDPEKIITELGTGEALVSLLDTKSVPMPVERAFVLPPHSQIGPIPDERRSMLIELSPLRSRYSQTIDRDSAYERLKQRAEMAAQAESEAETTRRKPSTTTRGRTPESPTDALMKGAARAIGSTLGREVVRGILGGLFGGRKR
ncbi:MAG: DUF853 family protein [bacterium]|nr:DUF853 family protein [bacterium]